MPVIPVTVTDATGYSDLPEGTYLAEVSAHVYNPATADKQQSVRIGFTIIEEGEQLGATTSMWQYFSEKAIGHTNDFYRKFGIEEGTEFVTADDSDDIVEPDIIGTQVIIQSKLVNDNRNPGEKRQRTFLVSVEDDPTEKVAPPPARRAATTVAKQAETDDEDDEEEEEAPAPRRRVGAKATTTERRSLR